MNGNFYNCSSNNGSNIDANVSHNQNTTVPRISAQFMSVKAYELLTYIFFLTIITTGVIGNGLVIATVFRWKEMRTPCNLFLLNISAADLCLTGIGGTLRIIEVYFGWIFGDFLCRFLAPLQDVFVCVSGITHSTIAWERYRATVTPFKPRISKGKTKMLIPVIWLGSYIACGLPLVIFTKLTQDGDEVFCLPMWSALYKRIFEVYLVVVFIVLQLVLQTFAYSNIISVLRSKCAIPNSKGSRNNSTDVADQELGVSSSAQINRNKQKAKTIKTLIVLVAVFQVCYVPRGTVMLVGEFSRNLPFEFSYIELVSLILYYLKHVLNPIILFSMSAEFKKGLRQMFPCCNCLFKRDQGKSSEKVPLRKASLSHSGTPSGPREEKEELV